MTNAEVEESGNDDAEISDVAKPDAEKIEEIKDDAKKAELPPTSSSLSVSLGFGDQFLKKSSDTSLIGTVKDTTDAEINSLLYIKIQSEVPHIQFLSVLTIPVLVISDPSVITPLQETPSTALVTSLPPPSVSTIPSVPHQSSTPIPTTPITNDAPTITTAILESDALSAIQLRVAKLKKDVYTANLIQKHSKKPTPESSKIQTPSINLEHESEKSASEIRMIKNEQAEKQKMPKYTIKSTDKATLKEYDQKSALYQTMHENKSFNKNPTNHALYHALMKALIEDENAMDKGVADIVKDHKRRHDDNEDDEDPSAGPNQGKKTKKRRTKESEFAKKPSTTKETSKCKALLKGSKTGKSATAKEPVKEPIIEVVIDDVVNTADKLDLNNLEGDRYSSDLSKPLPLQGCPDHLTVAANCFFNNDLDFLKTSDLEKTYTTSIMKIKDARYEIKGIEYMVPTLWSPTKVGYNKDVLKGIKHWGDRRDFLDLHLNDIKDMLLLAVQHKLFHLNDSDIVDFILALQCYQKKLNITAPQKTFPEIEFKELYTPSYNPPGVIYEDLDKHKRVMQADEMYKFSDGTLKTTAIDKKRSELMVELIDKQMRERMIIRNLERLVGAQELEMDYKRMTRTKELSQEQAYWLSANEIASNASNPATPVTPFVHNRPLYSHVLFHFQHKSANETIFKEVKEYEQIFDDLDAEYERCVLDNKNLTIEKKNLLIKNDCLIAECLEKDICSIVLTSDIVVPPSSNCLCEDLRSACDREHTKVLELEAEVLKQQKMVIESEKHNSHLQKTHIYLQLKFQNYKQCIDTSSASNAIFEINKLRKQFQVKDDTIRNLDAQINIMKVLNVGSTESSCDQRALETDRIQLKDTITSLRIQLDGLKVENVSLKRRYDELSKANTHSLTAENAKLKTELSGKKSGGSTASEKPKVLASGMYTKSSKYIPPPKRANWVKPTPFL
ncbi:hypothetical protein Tco_0421458 [Tanacetum coccineum]